MVWYRLTTRSTAPGQAGSRAWGGVASTTAAPASPRMTPSRLSGSEEQWMRCTFGPAASATWRIMVLLPHPGPLLIRYICMSGSFSSCSK